MIQSDYPAIIEQMLEELLPQETSLYERLVDSMRYSLLDGGKRVRPTLVLEFCRICGGKMEAALPYACAVEMVHTYSLIHDDLPCMDNDDMRRGKPSNHKTYGEDTALLAGDALLTMAFETMLSPDNVALAGPDRAAEAAFILASAAGMRGMVGGQVIDLASEGQAISLETLHRMDEQKTGALILAAARMGCAIAGANEIQRGAAARYAQAVGLSFQIMDDILDVTGDAESLGKPTGSDADNGKATYVSLMGLEKAQQAVRDLTAEAVKALEPFGPEAKYLAGFAKNLAARQN
ncbi:polyprenyl synthetase family protein [Anaeromassilibacillus senegalensis]|uniref:polyprenyl synthetase family protein n=1 Tax=Anaeromassilibacillus senegalensis TaxID=1673717 RepID=UPI000680BDBA|nr:farnesyl diphosphate synthase [Anaeromassilibacillus senegalensis]